MSVTPAPRPYGLPLPRLSTPASDRPSALEPRLELQEAARVTPAEWARRLRAEREARRVEAASSRVIHRLEHLGPTWHVVEWPTALPRQRVSDDQPASREGAGFLVIGPGGLFAVTVADHGRSRVLLAGDVVQINGKRPPYIAEARQTAKRATAALTQAVGQAVPVEPVLTFVGSGDISVHGLPKECLVATHRDLDRLLVSGGPRISPATAQKLSAVARHPATWLNGAYRSAADYRWYSEGRTATDKHSGRR